MVSAAQEMTRDGRSGTAAGRSFVLAFSRRSWTGDLVFETRAFPGQEQPPVHDDYTFEKSGGRWSIADVMHLEQ